MISVAHLPAVVALLAMLAASPASAQPKGRAEPKTPPAAAPTPAPAAEPKAQAPAAPKPIPAPEIAGRAEAVAKLLRELDALAAARATTDAIEARLPEVSARLGPEFESTMGTLAEGPPGTIVDRLEQSWRWARARLVASVEVLTREATTLEDALGQLAALSATWKLTREDARASRAPAAVVERVDAVLADIDATRARLEARRGATLVVQDRVAREVARCDDALARIDQHRREALARTFVRGTPSIWSVEPRRRGLRDTPTHAFEAFKASLAQVREFAGDHAGRMVLHGIFFLGLCLMARLARLERPYSSAAVVAVVSIVWIYPDRPRLIGDVAGTVLLVPMLRIVVPRAAPAMAPALYGLAALSVLDRLRAELAMVVVADQILLLLEMLAAMAGLAWILRSDRLQPTADRERIVRWGLPARRALVVFALVVCTAAFAAAAYGTMLLARYLGAGILFSAYVALAFATALHVTDGLLAFAIRVEPLRRLGMVARHGDFLRRRAHRLLSWVMAVAWAYLTLRFVDLLGPALALGEAALAAEIRRGTIGISLGDVVAFVLTVWLAFLASGLVRFVLEEDVYPRLGLARGLSYVVSSLLHYAVLFLGFLFAVAALGVDLTKATVLAGAFGVGLGFGLQGIVNNMVSGLIVLLERPIHVGDAIQMGELTGEVRKIGLRATTVRTWEGAEVIVPNASLVSEKVTNWTYSDRLRRMDIPVGVAYGNEPQKVLELLRAVATAHADVLAHPPPIALFLGFGDSALNFELRAWTNRFEQWVVIRSDVSVAVYAALRDAGIEIPFPQREVRLRQG